MSYLGNVGAHIAAPERHSPPFIPPGHIEKLLSKDGPIEWPQRGAPVYVYTAAPKIPWAPILAIAFLAILVR